MGDDAELLERWRAKDMSAGQALFRRHFDRVFRFFRNKVGHNADDLTQKTFLALLERPEGFEGRSSFNAYLFGVARNQLLMFLRTERREKAKLDPGTISIVDLGGSPLALATQHAQERLLHAALQSLPLDVQIAFEMRYWEGLDAAEIGTVLDVPPGTVRSRLSRGRRMLREALENVAAPSDLKQSTIAGLERWLKALPRGVASGNETG